MIDIILSLWLVALSVYGMDGFLHWYYSGASIFDRFHASDLPFIVPASSLSAFILYVGVSGLQIYG